MYYEHNDVVYLRYVTLQNVLMQSVCEKLPQDKCSRITGYSNDKYSLG